MGKLYENEVFASFLNTAVNYERLEPISHANGSGYGSYADCDEYIISHVDYYDKEAFIEKFRLSNAIRDRWDYYGIDFSVYLYLRDGKITGGHIFKYKETSMGCHFRPTGYEMQPTQQEIRIVRRILAYLTET